MAMETSLQQTNILQQFGAWMKSYRNSFRGPANRRPARLAATADKGDVQRDFPPGHAERFGHGLGRSTGDLRRGPLLALAVVEMRGAIHGLHGRFRKARRVTFEDKPTTPKESDVRFAEA
jgi:hypothetical protein